MHYCIGVGYYISIKLLPILSLLISVISCSVISLYLYFLLYIFLQLKKCLPYIYTYIYEFKLE